MIKGFGLFVLIGVLLIPVFSFECPKKCSFNVKETDQGMELLENGHPILNYQRKPKSLAGEYICNNYIHPLYSMKGDTLTEEFPADHPFHRGIFWAWHQLFIEGKSIGDGWIMKDILMDVFKINTQIKESSAQIDVDVHWKSTVWQNGNPFVLEHTTILVHQLKGGVRMIDFAISLKAIVPGVSIGGSDDEKGYGGFCARIKLPEDLVFTSEKGAVIPQNIAINTGTWMNFSGSFYQDKKKCTITMISLSGTPGYTTKWILRKAGSMQNIVFPGRGRIDLQLNRVVILKYRILLKDGILPISEYYLH